uniref:ABC transmembrane type-1 domain-containing protein n=1 Tax=Heterorhabditis bacteriophora TaxID=37862 RepID=A0A1I7XAT7_HETBA
MLLKQFIDFASLPEAPLSLGISIACLMFISAETRSFLQNHQVFGMFKLNVFYQSVLTNELLRKTLRLSPSERAKRTTGEILNMASVDIEKVVGAIPYLQNLWSVPFQITLAMIMLWITLGPATLAGLLIMALFVPLNYYSSKHIKKAQIAQMKVKDQRIAISNELLNGVKIVKLYAWEETFEKKITALRNEEVRLLKWVSVAGRMIDAANAAAPFLVALASLTTFVLTSEKYALTPSIAFVSLAIFNQIRQPMRLVGMMINTLTQVFIVPYLYTGCMLSRII